MPRSLLPGLGDLEHAVMEHLWARQEAGRGPVTVREVHATVGVPRELAYTTVMTVLDRLTRKGLVTQAREGRAYLYSATATRQALTVRTMRETLGTLQSSDRRAVMQQFLRDASPEEIEDLKAALAEIERGNTITPVEIRRTRPHT